MRTVERVAPAGATGQIENSPRLAGPRAEDERRRPALPVPGGADGRVLAEPKAGASAFMRGYIGVLRAALVIARRAGVPRAAVAARLGVSAKTLEHWVTPSMTALPTLEAGLGLVAPDGPLPPRARQLLLLWMDRQLARVSVDVLHADPDEDPVPVQVLQIVAAGGGLAAGVERALGGTSEGGARVTPAEAVRLLAVAEVQLRELAELKATLERLAGLGQRVDVIA